MICARCTCRKIFLIHYTNTTVSHSSCLLGERMSRSRHRANLDAGGRTPEPVFARCCGSTAHRSQLMRTVCEAGDPQPFVVKCVVDALRHSASAGRSGCRQVKGVSERRDRTRRREVIKSSRNTRATQWRNFGAFPQTNGERPHPNQRCSSESTVDGGTQPKMTTRANCID